MEIGCKPVVCSITGTAMTRPAVESKAPLRPLGGRGRGPGASAHGKVRWATPQTATSALLTLPSPPGRQGEREKKRQSSIFPGQPCAFAGTTVLLGRIKP